VNGICTNGFSAETFSSGETHQVVLNIRSLKTVPGRSIKPTDPDGDCLFEDVNANGVMDYDDAVILFWNVNWISQNEPVTAFNFNRNGIMDYDDAVTLFWKI
jgi:PKD repeat protein